MKQSPVYLELCVLIALILYGFALYFIPLQGASFHLDDAISIEENDAIKKIDISKIFGAFNTRFLVGLSFALNYRWSGVDPVGYRLINLLIHCLNAFLVYLLTKSTLYLYSTRKSMFFCRLEWPALFGAMLFLCHPIQTEPVNYITQRFVLMGSFFYLAALVFYIKSRTVGAGFKPAPTYYIFSLMAAVAAMFCKEFVVTLPLMLVLYEFYFFNSFKETIGKKFRRLIPFFVIALIVPVLLLRTPPETIGVARMADSNFVKEGGTQRIVEHIDITKTVAGMSRLQYFLTELNVVRTYVRLLFLPVNQNFDYDYPLTYSMDNKAGVQHRLYLAGYEYPLSDETNNKTLLSGVFLFCLLIIAVVTYQSYRIISFSILWFFITLSVESSFIPIGHVIAEYRLYLASVGFVFLVTVLIYTRQIDRKQINMIAAVILLSFSFLTYQRNKVWENEFTLWDDVVHGSPHKARPYDSRGITEFQQGNLPQAILDYNKAIEINPRYAGAYYNRGQAYYSQGNSAQAILDFNKAILLNPGVAQTYNNRGNSCVQQGNFTQAISDYSKAIEINPNYAAAYNNRGAIYAKQGNFTQAISDYNKVIETDPNYAQAYKNRGLSYARQGNFTQAISDFTKAIEINPNYADAFYNRALIYYYLKEYGKARADVLQIEALGAVIKPESFSAFKKALERVK